MFNLIYFHHYLHKQSHIKESRNVQFKTKNAKELIVKEKTILSPEKSFFWYNFSI